MTKFAFLPALRLLPLAVLALSACTNIQSSRNVNDSTVAGKTIAVQVCSSCHGVTGESTSPMFPKLAGQQRQYLVAQLTDFKGHDRSDSRGAEYMWGFTHLTDKQVGELADYFSAQSPMKGRMDAGPALARGKVIFDSGIPEKGVVQCSSCHGPVGQGNESFPRLAGQHSNYVFEQIKVFQLTDKRPRGAAMKQVTHELSDTDALAVSKYIESLGASR
ncbi:MAG: cytochrome c4 [Burkholderiales bacterium]|nr:cytochrome c4 [Burkholderiales bacterium]